MVSLQGAGQISAFFDLAGTYSDTLTRLAIPPYDLAPHVDAYAAFIPDFELRRVAATSAENRLVIECTLTGTNTGPLKTGIEATGRKMHLPPIDVLSLSGGRLMSAVRHFDYRALADQLGLQTIVEPWRQGLATYGCSIRVPGTHRGISGIMALTWIAVRDDAERDAVRHHSAQIISNFREETGFVGIVTSFAGERGFTVTAWENEEALHRALGKHQAQAKQDFRTSGFSPVVWTSVWKPHHINRLWVRCSI